MVVLIFFIISLKSLNGNFLLSPPRATYLPIEGYAYTSQSIGMAKSFNSGSGTRIGLGHKPTIHLIKAIHYHFILLMKIQKLILNII